MKEGRGVCHSTTCSGAHLADAGTGGVGSREEEGGLEWVERREDPGTDVLHMHEGMNRERPYKWQGRVVLSKHTPDNLPNSPGFAYKA